MSQSPDTVRRDGVSALVLAGGRSTRMGHDKALLELHGKSIIQRTVETLRHLTDDIVVVGRSGDLFPPAATIPDEMRDGGPMGGLATGLAAARNRSVVCVSCDLPFLDSRVLELLLSRATQCEAVVPRIRDRAQPLHAVYDRAILPIVRTHLDARRLSMRGLLDDLRVCWIGESDILPLDPQLRSFTNINTPEDWNSVRSAPFERSD